MAGGFAQWMLTNYPNTAMQLALFFQTLRKHGMLAALRGVVKRNPFALLLLTNAATAVVLANYLLKSRGGLMKVLVAVLFSAATKLPGAAAMVDKETKKVVRDMEKKMVDDEMGDEKRFPTLPQAGMPVDELMGTLAKYTSKDQAKWRTNKVSGCIYHGGDDLTTIIARAYEMFALANPLHPDVFPFVRKMEAEVVAWTVELFQGGKDACGTMTSGGTESILMAVKSCRDFAEAKRGITEPEMVVPRTAHAAFDKAAHYFKIRMVHVDVDPKTFRAVPSAMRAAINRNTIMLVGSAPNFPQGVIDPIEELGAIALEKGLPLHVDCCLGSYLVAFLEAAGHRAPRFNFSVPGVTSISCDTHKFGYAPKGSSVVMYSTQELRTFQFFCVTDWPGGVYGSPSMAGSRPGALIAGTWAALMRTGKSGYLQAAKEIMASAGKIRKSLEAIPEVELLGAFHSSVVCFRTTKASGINIFNVGDMMSRRHWNLNMLQFPSAIHLCVTYANRNMHAEFAADLRASIEEVKSAPKGSLKGGFAAMYGMAESLPDRSIISNLTKGFFTALYKV